MKNIKYKTLALNLFHRMLVIRVVVRALWRLVPDCEVSSPACLPGTVSFRRDEPPSALGKPFRQRTLQPKPCRQTECSALAREREVAGSIEAPVSSPVAAGHCCTGARRTRLVLSATMAARKSRRASRFRAPQYCSELGRKNLKKRQKVDVTIRI